MNPSIFNQFSGGPSRSDRAEPTVQANDLDGYIFHGGQAERTTEDRGFISEDTVRRIWRSVETGEGVQYSDAGPFPYVHPGIVQPVRRRNTDLPEKLDEFTEEVGYRECRIHGDRIVNKTQHDATNDDKLLPVAPGLFPIILPARAVSMILDGKRSQFTVPDYPGRNFEPGQLYYIREPFDVDTDGSVFYAADFAALDYPWLSAETMRPEQTGIILKTTTIKKLPLSQAVQDPHFTLREGLFFAREDPMFMSESLYEEHCELSMAMFNHLWDKNFGGFAPRATDPQVWVVQFIVYRVGSRRGEWRGWSDYECKTNSRG